MRTYDKFTNYAGEHLVDVAYDDILQKYVVIWNNQDISVGETAQLALKLAVRAFKKQYINLRLALEDQECNKSIIQ